ncbi:hypothetical protein Lal_00046817 [Lupinus albus]|nr:hypothetical protein Lal_00046817 [Lupinus albus]
MHATTQLGTVRPDRHLNSTHFSEGRGNRRRVVDCFNHGRALASTVLNPHRVHFRMFGNLPLSATDMPLKGTRRPTSFRAERVTLEASARPRDANSYPSRHCEARPAPQQSTLSEGQGDRRDVVGCVKHGRTLASTMMNRPWCTSG